MQHVHFGCPSGSLKLLPTEELAVNQGVCVTLEHDYLCDGFFDNRGLICEVGHDWQFMNKHPTPPCLPSCLPLPKRYLSLATPV